MFRVLGYALLSLLPIMGVFGFILVNQMSAMQTSAQQAFERETDYIHNLDWSLIHQDQKVLQDKLIQLDSLLSLDSVMWFNPNFELIAQAGAVNGWRHLPQPQRNQGFYLNEGLWSSVHYVYDNQKLIGVLRTAETVPSYASLWRTYNTWVYSLFLAMILAWGIFLGFTLRALKKAFTWRAHSCELDLGQDKATIKKFKHDFGPLASSIVKWVSRYKEKIDCQQETLTRLHLTLEGSRLVDFYWSIEKDELVFSPPLRQLLGYYPNEGIMSLEGFILKLHEEDLESFQEELSEHLKNKTDFFEAVFRVANARADYIWLLCRGQVVERTAQGEPSLMVGTVCDVTEKQIQEQKLKLIQDAFNFTSEAMVITDPNLRIIEVNQAFHTITGFPLDQIKGKSIETLYSNQHPPSFYTNIRSTLEHDHQWQGEIIQQKQSGELFPSLLSISSINDKEGLPRYYITIFVDQTAQTQQKDEIEFLASYDSLTRLMNRDQFAKRIEKKLHISVQAREVSALMIIGINKFKLMNDTFGHSTGDELLMQTARRLQKIMPPQALLARLGGDEFGLFIEHVVDNDSLESLAHDILLSLQESYKIDGHDIIISSCIGISVCPHDAKTMAALMVNADTALVHAKQDERNSYQFFVPYMNEEVQARQKLETQLRSAIDNNELILYYQPKVEIKTGRVVGAEALLRWPHQELGFVSPDSFIPIAEETGLIIPISEWVFRQACMQGQLWRNKGWTEFTISVNVSGSHFKKDDFAEFMQKLLYETGFPASNLDLEITEGALVADIEHCILILKVLKSMGMTLSVDDFGTGYSSLSYLRMFPVDTLKVDRSFVQNMMCNKEDANITTAVIAMAKGLKLSTVAEGVETLEQLNALKQLECDYVQGFYYSKALPPEAFEHYFVEQNKKAQAS